MNAPTTIELRDGKLQGLEIGPKLAACSEKERIFAVAFATGVAKDAADAARIAGYGSAKTHKQAAYHIGHKQRVIEAVEEISRSRFRNLIPKAISAAERLIEDPAHKDHAKTVVSLLSKLGYAERTAVDVNVSGELVVDHTVAAVDDLERFKALGVPHEKLVEIFGFSGLGRYEAMLVERNARAPKLIEAKAEEVMEEAT